MAITITYYHTFGSFIVETLQSKSLNPESYNNECDVRSLSTMIIRTLLNNDYTDTFKQ